MIATWRGMLRGSSLDIGVSDLHQLGFLRLHRLVDLRGEVVGQLLDFVGQVAGVVLPPIAVLLELLYHPDRLAAPVFPADPVVLPPPLLLLHSLLAASLREIL